MGGGVEMEEEEWVGRVEMEVEEEGWNGMDPAFMAGLGEGREVV